MLALPLPVILWQKSGKVWPGVQTADTAPAPVTTHQTGGNGGQLLTQKEYFSQLVRFLRIIAANYMRYTEIVS